MTLSAPSTRRLTAGAVLATLIAALLILIAPPARAQSGDPSQDVIRELAVEYVIDENGTLFVTETFQWDFGSRDGLGFYRALVQQMGWEPDTSKARVLEYSDFAVSSPSGAPAEIWVESDYGSMLRLAVGAPDGSTDTRSGVQTYVLTYQVDGAINAVRGQEGVSDQDELFYNVFNDSPNRVDNVSVTVTGPAGVVDVACYTGEFGDDSPCEDYASSGSTATFAQTDIARRGGLTIMAAYPADTFANPGPILVDRPSSSSGTGGSVPGEPAPPPGPLQVASRAIGDYWPLAAGGWAAVLGGITALRIRRGRDWIYQGIAPGQLPAEGAPATAVRMKEEPPVAVRFHPPDGIRPAEGEVIEEEHVTDEAFTATMIDLAVRGYLTIGPAKTTRSGKVTDWELTANPQGPPRSELSHYENELMKAFFASRSQVRISELRGKFAEKVGKFNKALTERSDTSGWFSRRGLASSAKLTGIGLAFFFVVAMFINAGAAAFRALAQASFFPLVIAAMVVTVSLILVFTLTSKAAHARSALGRAHYEQIRGFR
ncbi:MAG: DUF2207 domain-containing protein, partial [bacterium]|nr:DUF2207 domain-containing protein [bacterium]